MSIKIEDLTLAQLREIAKLIPQDVLAQIQPTQETSSYFKPGDKVFIRTITLYYTGRVVQISAKEIVLDEATWVADTRHFSKFLKDGPPKEAEIEPYPGICVVNRDAVIDMSIWLHDLPKAQQ